jgi:short-subunit dehydrogenase
MSAPTHAVTGATDGIGFHTAPESTLWDLSLALTR